MKDFRRISFWDVAFPEHFYFGRIPFLDPDCWDAKVERLLQGVMKGAANLAFRPCMRPVSPRPGGTVNTGFQKPPRAVFGHGPSSTRPETGPGCAPLHRTRRPRSDMMTPQRVFSGSPDLGGWYPNLSCRGPTGCCATHPITAPLPHPVGIGVPPPPRKPPTRHRHCEQWPLHRPTGLEPVALREGSANWRAHLAPESGRAIRSF